MIWRKPCASRKLLTLFGSNNKQGGGDKEQSSENINIDHRVIDNRHDNYDLINIKQIVQNTKESANPNKTTDQLKLSANNGPINTEAKNICPTSAEMSTPFPLEEGPGMGLYSPNPSETPAMQTFALTA